MTPKPDRTKKNIAELTRYSNREYKSVPKLPLRVVADNVRSMHNVGSLFRTSDAFLVDMLVLGGISGCPPHAEISKTALGAEEAVEWIHVDDTAAEVARLQSEGWTICVLEQTHNSIPLGSFRIGAPCRVALVVGNEVHGVDQRIVDMADHVLEIPQHGTKHSLNVAASGAIALYRLAELLSPFRKQAL